MRRLILCLMVLVYGVGQVQGAVFQGLGHLPGGDPIGRGSSALAVSADGSVVVGESINSEQVLEAFIWSREGGMVGLGFLDGHDPSVARGVSSDGTVVVGQSGGEAFRWTADDGMVGLGDFSEPTLDLANGVSADGTVVVGWGQMMPFRWKADEGMVNLGSLSDHHNQGYASAASADGLVVVGYSENDARFPEAFCWTADDGMVGLGFLTNENNPYSIAYDVSDDGTTVVGKSAEASNPIGYDEAFLWTSEDGMVGLGHLPGDNHSVAHAVSSDGSIVVGSSSNNVSGPYKAFIWDESNGIRDLKSVLESDFGLDISGWISVNAFDISDDGLTIVGGGIDPHGESEAWIADLRVIPEPSSLLLLLSSALAIIAYNIKRRRR